MLFGVVVINLSAYPFELSGTLGILVQGTIKHFVLVPTRESIRHCNTIREWSAIL